MQDIAWQVIAMRISNEQDSQKLSELTRQLLGALEEEEERTSAKIHSEKPRTM